MYLDNYVSFRYDRPTFFEDIIEVSANCQLTDQEKICLKISLELMEAALKKDSITINDYRVTVVFIDSDTLTIRNDDDCGTLAWYNQIICFHVNRWRKRSLTEQNLIVIMLEEFCHYFYQIVDESLVKDKVAEVAQLRFPGLTRKGLYQFIDNQ